MTITEMIDEIVLLNLTRQQLANKEIWDKEDFKKDRKLLDRLIYLTREIEKLEGNYGKHDYFVYKYYQRN